MESRTCRGACSAPSLARQRTPRSIARVHVVLIQGGVELALACTRCNAMVPQKKDEEGPMDCEYVSRHDGQASHTMRQTVPGVSYAPTVGEDVHRHRRMARALAVGKDLFRVAA